jgi:K+/H+ antiporter YhaU regulatory subunit KhtT
MMEDRMRKIEARIQQALGLPETEREKLLQLVSTLREEVAALARSHEEEARSIAHFLDASTHEASRTKKQPKLLEAARLGLTGSVENFESSHPKLFATVNQAAVVLANMGL